MAQINNGIRAILSHPRVYSAFQFIMGGSSDVRLYFVEQFIRPEKDMRILDIGCGPAEILDYLPDVDYWGFDISESYIKRAQERYANRGTFRCQILDASDVGNMMPFDVVLALGLLHHLDDEDAIQTITLAHGALKPGGRLITVDPCFESGQNPVARFMVKHDRGKNVRNQTGYSSLAAAVFKSCRVEVRHTHWIPYTHCIMECVS